MFKLERLTNEMICSFPISKIKKILKYNQQQFISKATINEFLKNNKKSENLLKDLFESGYIEETNDQEKFVVSARGNVLINTNIKRLLDQQKAEEKIDNFLHRVKKVNASKTYLYYVDQVTLSGDYLKCKDFIRELHFDVLLSSKYEDQEIMEDLENKKRKKAKKPFSNYIEYLFFPQFEIRDFLKNGTHNIIVTIDRVRDWEEKKNIFLRK